jgi:2-iminobutanoate/2-iminopropanoate deaminase
MKEIIRTPDAPQAIGPYSQAIRVNGMVFLSGQIAIDPRTQQLVEGDVAVQTERVLMNVEAVLKAAGSGMEKAIKTTVYLKDINDFAKMNEVYGRFFKENPPARSTVAVARIPRDRRVEIDVIALV